MLEFDADLRLYTYEFSNVNNSEIYDGHRPCTDLKQLFRRFSPSYD